MQRITVTVIDYGLGNLRSVTKALEKLGCEVELTSEPERVGRAERLVLPGVGAFGEGMAQLHRLALVEPVREVIAAGRAFLGICLGLQLLFEESFEMGRHEGLQIIHGKVVPFPEVEGIRVPHMGWNALKLHQPKPLFNRVRDGDMVYFVHSYYVVPEDDSVIAATTKHGVEFVSAIAKDNVFGTQFHPEKSSHVGLAVLKNFANLKM